MTLTDLITASDTDELLLETSEDDEGREARGEGGQGQTGQQLGQQEGGPGVDTLPRLLIIPGAGTDNYSIKRYDEVSEHGQSKIHLHVMEVEMMAIK